MSSFDPPRRATTSVQSKITYGRFPRSSGPASGRPMLPSRSSGGLAWLQYCLQSLVGLCVSFCRRVISGLTIGRGLAVIGGIGLLLMPVFYGVRVQLESYLRTLGEKTQAEQTDNQIKQSLLSRLESFQASSRLRDEFPNLHHNPDALVIPVRMPQPRKLSLVDQIWQFWAGPPPEEGDAEQSPSASVLTSNQY